jgi:predicted HTH transcriptional regulator
MLKVIDQSLDELLKNSTKKLTDESRIQLFLDQNNSEFSRKDYLSFFRDISTSTASRDLRSAVAKGLIRKYGDKKTSTYRKR